jgi:hypothetical protein
VWITVSTRQRPRANGYRSDVADGFIVLVDKGEARIVARDLGYTNECVVHPDGKRLYVNETFSRRLTAFDIEADGKLSNRQTITTFGAGIWPDGLTFDQGGHVWITSIISNRLIRVDPAGRQTLFMEDVDPLHLQWVERAYRDHALGRPHLDGVKSKVLQNISSLAFGGDGFKTGYFGCLLGQQIASMPMPEPGVPPVHRDWDISAWLA